MLWTYDVFLILKINFNIKNQRIIKNLTTKKNQTFKGNKMNEHNKLLDILDDLRLLLKQNEILGQDFDDFHKKLKSDTVKNYLLDLKKGSKPEDALKNRFFSSGAVFAKYLFKNLSPEIGGEAGFIDYSLEVDGEIIGIEIKPLFKAEFERGKSGRIIRRIKKIKLDWIKYRDQIRKYLGKKGEFIVFTNLEEWYFFSRNYSLDEDCKYFSNVDLFRLIKDFDQTENFWVYLDNQENLSIKEPLDKKFFSSLKTWVQELRKVKFSVDGKEKTKLIINLINKFIFIQSLDKFWVIQSKYIENKWSNIEREWQAKNKLRILKKFLGEINEYFYELYDTELFRDREDGKNILDYIQKDEENIELFYNKLKLILGIDYGATAIGWVRGIIQYNFRRIDEDILGKAYETFLAEVRKEQGIYYTPKYITQYIVDNTVGKQYEELLSKIKTNLEKSRFDECRELIEKFISIKVLDPACGSGSFLIKALKIILSKYEELNQLLDSYYQRHNNFKGTLKQSPEDKEISEKINQLKKILDYKDKRDLISKIIIRHIHGNDLDGNALEVAKVNLWLEAIKLAPREFRFDIPRETNHILPDLEINLGNGDSLVGLPEDKTIQFLKENYEKELKEMSKLRKKYLKNPTDEEAIEELNKIKHKLKQELDKQFRQYLKDNNLPEEIFEKTKPFHWALEFWYVYFDDKGEPKPKEQQGFDAVIGNPPYVNVKELDKILKDFYKKHFNIIGRPDLYLNFIERGLDLTTNRGYFSYITSNKFLVTKNGENIREKIKNQATINLLVDLSMHPIFKDASVYPIVFSLQKTKINEKRVTIKIYPPSNLEITNLDSESIKTNQISEDLLYDDEEKIINLNVTPFKKELIKKIKQESIKLQEILDLELGMIVGNQKELIILENEFDLLPATKRNGYKQIIGGEDVRRYEILQKPKKYIFYDKEKIISPRSENFFEREKIVIKDIGLRLSCSLDKDNLYALQTLILGFLKSSNNDISFIIGLLNSLLLDFYYKYKFSSVHVQGGYNRYRERYLKNFPIHKATEQEQKPIIQLVNKIITLKKLQHKFREIWREYSQKFRNSYRSLGEILLDDKKSIQEGNFDKVWISEASLYPNGTNELIEKEFDNFRIAGKNNNILKVFGISGSKEELILELKAKNKEFRDTLYLEILELFDSRSKVKSLKDIFDKTIISVIQPNIWEKSGNLIKGVKKKFEEWLEKQDFKVKEKDIVEIDNQIQDVDNQIDAHVFKLYKLNREEVETVLDSLNVLESIKNDILKKFEELVS